MPVTGIRTRRRPMVGLAAVQAAMAVGAIGGGYGLLDDAEGLGMREEWLAGSPFPDYTVPGVVLLVGIGGGMLVSAVLALAGHRLAHLTALVMGAALALWLVIETAVIGVRAWQQVVLVALCGAAAVYLMRDGVAHLRPARWARASA